MKPMQKYRLLVLAVLSPYFFLLVFGLITRIRSGKWVAPVVLAYSIGALAFMIRYLVTHPELRPTEDERAKRLAAIDPRKARLMTITVSLLLLLASSLYLVFAHQPSSLVRTQGFESTHTVWLFSRGAAWTCVGVNIAIFARVCQVANRK